MKFSDEDKGVLKYLPNLSSSLIAVLVAVAMWYFVNASDRFETQVDVNIDYYGIPPNLVVTEGLISKLSVRLKGPETLLRSLPRDGMMKSINLSSITKGVTIVPIPSEELGLPFRAFEVVDIQPTRIVVKADSIMEKSVPVRVDWESPLKKSALTVENVSVSPATAILRGPEGVVSGINNLPVSLMVDPKAQSVTMEQTVTLDTPNFVTANPPIVKIRYTVTSGRETITRRCKIKIPGDNGGQYALSPDEISVNVEVPEALANNSHYLRELEVTVVPPHMELDESVKVKPRFKLPDGMTLLVAPTEEITITKIKP